MECIIYIWLEIANSGLILSCGFIWIYTKANCLAFNRRMPKCNSVLLTEEDLFQYEIWANLPKNCCLSTFIQPPKSSKTFGHTPVKIRSSKAFKTFLGKAIHQRELLTTFECVYSENLIEYAGTCLRRTIHVNYFNQW